MEAEERGLEGSQTKEKFDRILAAMIGEKGKIEHRQIGNLGNRRPKMNMDRHPLDKGRCAYCKEKGHWARECPKKKGRDSKVLVLEEDD